MNTTSEQLIQTADPFKLELLDEEFVDVIDQRIADSTAYYNKKHLKERQIKMREYYVGQQGVTTDPKKLPKYATPYLENIIFGGISRQKPIALSRLPDMVVKAGDGGKVSRDSAETLTDLMNTDIKTRQRRRVLGRAFKEQPLNLYAVIKCRWNEELGYDGDYEFVNVHPDNVNWDHTCKTSDVDDMSFFAEDAEFNVKEITMMFPKKADAFLGEVGLDDPNKRTESKMASKYTITEVHFHWYKEHSDEATGEKKWEKINAIAWKYKKLILYKMKTAYFDYEGKINYFSKAKREKREPTEEELYEAMFGDDIGTKFYNNYFRNPRKPYYFMTYENMGEDPVDVTSRIEQSLLFQDHINLEGLQISEMNARTVGKPVINAQMIDKADAKNIDWKDHNQAIIVSDDVRQAFAHIPGIPAPQQMYKSKQDNRSNAYEMIGVNATTRGLRENDSTLGQDQMAREADYGMIDDIVEETLNGLAEWMGQWSMQMIKMFYTKKHFKDVVGKDGDSLYTAITQDLVEDGMVVEIGASGVDKIQRKRLAIQNMNSQAGDLLSYYEDTAQSSPKERARRAFMFQNAPQMYYQEYLVDDIKQPDAVTQPTMQPPQGIQMPPGQTSIPMMAQGGIVNKPTLAMIGEAGPEAVVPLSGNNDPLGIL